jgi:nucleoside-diphosphate-sugar epimerase
MVGMNFGDYGRNKNGRMTSIMVSLCFLLLVFPNGVCSWSTRTLVVMSSSSSSSSNSGEGSQTRNVFAKSNKGKILVLGGSGYLGGNVARRAVLEGYTVTSLSRRGKPQRRKRNRRNNNNNNNNKSNDNNEFALVENNIDFRVGDARDGETVQAILREGNYTAVVHCIGLLFDGNSGLSMMNRFVSGSGSIPDPTSTYDDVNRRTAINAIEAAEQYVSSTIQEGRPPLPFIFISAAEAGWTDVTGGSFVENRLTPRWLKRYLKAKRSVEQRLSSTSLLRPIIFRPSLIFSLDRLQSLPPVTAFFVGNQVGLPFVDRPVSVQALSSAIVRSVSDPNLTGIQRYKEINQLSR